MNKKGWLSKQNFCPANWPLEKRRLVAWIGITLIMSILLVFWLYSLRLSFIAREAKEAQPLLDIKQIRQDLDSGLEEVNKGSELLKKIATTTSSINPEDQLLQEQNRLQLEKLRQKLEQLPNQSTD